MRDDVKKMGERFFIRLSLNSGRYTENPRSFCAQIIILNVCYKESIKKQKLKR